MPRKCVCGICTQHYTRGSLLYTTNCKLTELSPMRQHVELVMHKQIGVCPHFGAPFEYTDLTPQQRTTYLPL